MRDPIENIMDSLRRSGSVDPASAQARQSGMKMHRDLQGAGPRVHPRTKPDNRVPDRPPRDELSATLDDIGGQREEGREGDVGVAPGDMTPIIVDQLNETILSLKVQIHRTQDPEQRRQFEQQAEQIRQQVVNMGGDPVWADESVEEGLQKLRGHGYIGGDQLNQQLDEHIPIRQTMEDLGHQVDYDADTRRIRLTDPRTGRVGDIQPDAYRMVNGSAHIDPAFVASWMEQPDRAPEPEPGVDVPTAPEQEEPRWDPFDEFFEPTRRDDLITDPPDPRFNEQEVNRLIREYGLEPMSEQQIQEYADAKVDRQVLGREQAIQRNIDRFESDHPDEFERAKTKIREASAEIAADRQEEFAARGMHYSSIMSNSLTEIDEATMEQIGDIARDAARYVSDLHRDLQDLEEWAAVEREVLRHEIGAEERDVAMNLATVRLEAMQHGDQMALQAWQMEEQLHMQDRESQLREWQTNVEHEMMRGNLAGVARLAQNPDIFEAIEASGVSVQQFEEMPLAERASMVESAMQFKEWDLNIDRKKMENEMLGLELSIDKKYAEDMARMAWEQAGLELDEVKMRYDALVEHDYFYETMGMELEQMEQEIDLMEARGELTRAQAALARTQARVAQINAGVAQQRANLEARRVDMDEKMIERELQEIEVGGIQAKLFGAQESSQESVAGIESAYGMLEDATHDILALPDGETKDQLLGLRRNSYNVMKKSLFWDSYQAHGMSQEEIEAAMQEDEQPWWPAEYDDPGVDPVVDPEDVLRGIR